ncbi:mitochondrial outer membrane translocase complex, subunit Tom20 domain-containing protein [Kockovaella imperatae]|uniref:Mitochondrial outer membrane translocase complex, subunit Tom20 domain-containing protein n=1 Tax=Kockovaella imperatae TaxID=4999 RepID=A0A1Y1UJL6_9TREE|nr:mitochondrial outer membrane translocase complex, subunit Tom20 domain-containing protein [Kockovaella imperatae]ORX38243.1 mitochondrial outer membrane translocase complex, subunit Tom20 domain-containing protein [Kockovaella imperatae]
MASRTPAQVALITTGAILTGLVGYAVYFDYQRRHNPEFRKSIKKQHKKVRAAAEARNKAEKDRNSKLLREALKEIQAESPPSAPEQQEMYFQEHVGQGEQLAAMGPDSYVEAAAHFYRALRVYPQPVELLMIYQKVAPPPVFALLLELTSLTGGGPAGAGAGFGAGGPPPQAPASIDDIDEGGSPTGDSQGTSSGSGMGSGGDWERVSEGA